MTLYRLIYASRARHGLSFPDLRDIMEKSEHNNPILGLTGFLCFGDGMFLQALEGGRRAISQKYHRIAQDERHCEPELIEFVSIPERQFGSWSMRLVQMGSLDPGYVAATQLKYSSSREFNPAVMTAEQCLRFMADLHQFSQLTSSLA